MHPELKIEDIGKNGGKRPGAGRPKGTTHDVVAMRRLQGITKLRFITQKRERELWDHAIKLAVKNRNVDALIRILVAVGQFHYGKPYEALNPALANKPPAGDGKLLMAIQNLQIVSPSPSPTSKTQVVESKAIPVLPSDCQESSTDSDSEAPGDAASSSEETESE